MSEWEADFVTDPNDDCNIAVDVYYGDEHMAIIKRSNHGPVIKWYKDLTGLEIPVKWLLALLLEAERDIPKS